MKEAHEMYLWYGILIVVLVSFLFIIGTTFLQDSEPQKTQYSNTVNVARNNVQSTSGQFKTITLGTTDEGDVSIALTPRIEQNTLFVTASINTHSVPLESYDLTKIVTLSYDRKTVFPTKAPKLSGHHINDALIFPLETTPKTFTITMKGIPKQEERVFSWY